MVILKQQKNIQKQISEVTSKDLNKKKNEDYDKSLNVTNRKACIFRDIIIESECKSLLFYVELECYRLLFLFYLCRWSSGT